MEVIAGKATELPRDGTPNKKARALTPHTAGKREAGRGGGQIDRAKVEKSNVMVMVMVMVMVIIVVVVVVMVMVVIVVVVVRG